eukprot:930387_1
MGVIKISPKIRATEHLEITVNGEPDNDDEDPEPVPSCDDITCDHGKCVMDPEKGIPKCDCGDSGYSGDTCSEGGKRRNMDLSPAVNLIEKVLVTPRGLEMIVHNSYGLDLWVTTDPATESMTSEQLRNHPAVLHKRPCVVKNGAIMIPIPTVTMGSLYLIAAQIRATESEYVLADEIEIPFDLQVKLLVDGYVKNNYPDVYPEDTVNMIHNSAGHHYSSWNMMTKEDERQ